MTILPSEHESIILKWFENSITQIKILSIISPNQMSLYHFFLSRSSFLKKEGSLFTSLFYFHTFHWQLNPLKPCNACIFLHILIWIQIHSTTDLLIKITKYLGVAISNGLWGPWKLSNTAVQVPAPQNTLFPWSPASPATLSGFFRLILSYHYTEVLSIPFCYPTVPIGDLIQLTSEHKAELHSQLTHGFFSIVNTTALHNLQLLNMRARRNHV